jgi:hypothetical protein
MNVAPDALPAYERLRVEVLSGQARPEGLAAIVYHGMLRGLAVILTEVAPEGLSSPLAVPVPQELPLDRDLLRVITNMVLQSQAEMQHVY